MPLARKIFVLVLLIAVAFLAGYWLRRPQADAVATGRRILYYHDPMHPAYKSDKPGIAPDCGMQLEPVYADDPTGGAMTGPMTPGTVRISLEKQQIMGLRTARVTAASGSHVMRVLGRVTPDETRVHKITALADGVVRLVSAFAVGDVVHRDDLLARYYVALPEIYNAIQAYFVAMTTLDQRLAVTTDERLIDQAKAQIRLSEELLQTYGMSESQIKEIAKTRAITRDIEFRSPVTGLVLARNVSVGQRLERGAELFRIADLNRVWVLADLFENESGLVRPGTPARVNYQGRSYHAAMSDARQFDPVSRTLKARLELDNPGLLLRPDMFVEVEFDVREPSGITVPVDALLDSGRRRVVFVATGEGAFEPREVTTGARYGDRLQIVKGLAEGENVVVSGLFLLDSESRLQLAAAGPAKPAVAGTASAAANTDPVCGMEVDISKSAHKSVYEGITYHFCSESCKGKFDKDPAKYAAKRTSATTGGAQ